MKFGWIMIIGGIVMIPTSIILSDTNPAYSVAAGAGVMLLFMGLADIKSTGGN